MSRKRTTNDDNKTSKARVRTFRNRDRNAQRKTKDDDLGDRTWLTRSSAKMAAMQVLNDYRERPYILSIPEGDGPEPISGFYPCSMAKRDGRVYYFFLFREHRDATCAKWPDARKEYSS